MIERRICTRAEMEAYHVLVGAGYLSITTADRPNFHDAGNKIIELAEKIKAERAVVAMEK